MPTLMAVIERDPESGTYIGYFPQVPLAQTYAATIEELRPRLQEVLHLVLEDMLAHGKQLPEGEFVGIEAIDAKL